MRYQADPIDTREHFSHRRAAARGFDHDDARAQGLVSGCVASQRAAARTDTFAPGREKRTNRSCRNRRADIRNRRDVSAPRGSQVWDLLRTGVRNDP